MANHKSAIKRIRTSEKRRLFNRNFRNRTRTLVKKARKQIRVNNPNAESVNSAIEATRQAVKDLDMSVSRGVLHARNAARRKSRLMKQLAAMQTKASAKV